MKSINTLLVSYLLTVAAVLGCSDASPAMARQRNAAPTDKAAKKSDVVLPYNNTNPVMYDNDWTNDYVDWYLMALASAGDIKYHGISTSSSVAPYNRHMTAKDLATQVTKRREIVRRGRDSGFRHVPEPIPGTKGNLTKPALGRIEDTRPLGSPGSRRIVEQAGKATPTKPLVVCVGGPLTVVADAYLLDNSIADKVVVAWLDNHNKGMTGFNGWSDGWAAFIVLEKLRLVQFTVQSKPFAHVPKSRLHTLPDTEAREYMLALQTDVVAPEGDADGPPAISLMRPDYVRSAKRVSFGGWTTRDGHDMPLFRDDPNGRAIVVISVDRKAATEEWWRAMKNPAAWRQTNDSGTQSSGNGNATSAQTIQAPYPSSPVVRAMRLDWSTHKRFAQGSDNFQLTWVDDSHLYGAWGDGGSFGGTNEGGRVSLGVARVDKGRIFESRDHYEFFTGLDKNGSPKWGGVSAKQPVFGDKNGTGWCISVSYNPGLGRYILCTEHTESCKGNLCVFDAPEPWGPWTMVEYIDGWGKSHVELNNFFWSFPTKWLSNDGREFTLAFTGVGGGLNNDSFNTVRGRFILKDVPGRPIIKNP